MKSSWYCLLGKDAGKILDMAGLRHKEPIRSTAATRPVLVPVLVPVLPHGVRQSQDTQDEEIDGQQQVDVLLREDLWDGGRSVRDAGTA